MGSDSLGNEKTSGPYEKRGTESRKKLIETKYVLMVLYSVS